MRHRRAFRVFSIALILDMAFMGRALFAQKEKGNNPVIIAASVSTDLTTLFVVGSGFGSSPTVILGGWFLGGVVVNNLGTELTALMPTLPSGTYQLFVQVGNNKTSAFEMTLGIQGPQGDPGPAGAMGPQGPQGPQGPSGFGTVSVRFIDKETPGSTNDSATAVCEAGEVATGGGVQLRSGDAAHTYYFEPGGVPNVVASGSTPTGWRASWYQDTANTEIIRVWVICAATAP